MYVGEDVGELCTSRCESAGQRFLFIDPRAWRWRSRSAIKVTPGNGVWGARGIFKLLLTYIDDDRLAFTYLITSYTRYQRRLFDACFE